MDLLTSEEEKIDNQTRQDGLDIPLLTKHLIGRKSQVINVSNSFYSLEQRHQTNIFHIRFCFVKKIGVSV